MAKRQSIAVDLEMQHFLVSQQQARLSSGVSQPGEGTIVPIAPQPEPPQLPCRGSHIVVTWETERVIQALKKWGTVTVEDDCGLLRLPTDILLEIARGLPISTLLALRQVRFRGKNMTAHFSVAADLPILCRPIKRSRVVGNGLRNPNVHQ